MSNVILTSALVTVGSTVANEMLPESLGGHGEIPSPRLLVGGALTFTGLSILDGFAPGLARPLAATIAVTAVSLYGIPIVTNYMKKGKKAQ